VEGRTRLDGRTTPHARRRRTGSSGQVQEGWLGAVEAIASWLTHIADCTVLQAQAKASTLETPSASPSRTPRPSHTPVDSVGEERVHRILEAAERIFVSLTGHTGFDRDLSEEILMVVLKSVGAEQQEGCVRQLEAACEGGGSTTILRTISAQLLHQGAHALILDTTRVSHLWAKELPTVTHRGNVAGIHDALVGLGTPVAGGRPRGPGRAGRRI
jgi:hypothetical protein